MGDAEGLAVDPDRELDGEATAEVAGGVEVGSRVIPGKEHPASIKIEATKETIIPSLFFNPFPP